MSETDPGDFPSFEGHLLVASPELNDPNFARSVVLIIQHGAASAFGLVLTRSTNLSVEQVWQKVSESTCRTRDAIYCGGPVEGPLMAVHADRSVGGSEILPGVFYSVSAQQLEQLVASNAQPARYFIGYAGWGEGQLDREFEAGGWYAAHARPDDLFQIDEGFWEATLRRVAGQSILKSMGIDDFPRDLSAN